MALTATRLDQINALYQIQGHQAHAYRDIVTFAGWRDVTDADVSKHIDSCIEQIANWIFEQAQKRTRKAA